MMRLLLWDVLPLEDESLYRECYHHLSDFRREKADRLRFDKNRLLSVGASVLLDYGLREWGLREKTMRYALDKNGKPYFEDHPSLHFNISHSEKQVLVALADREIGCDIEKIRPIDQRIAARFFCAEEYDRIMQEPDTAAQSRMFFRLWTMKESFIKATGDGFRLPLSRFYIRLEDMTVACDDIDETYYLHEYEDGAYRIAVCAGGERPAVALEKPYVLPIKQPR